MSPLGTEGATDRPIVIANVSRRRFIQGVSAMGGLVLAAGFSSAALERIRKRFPFTGAKLFRNLARILTERLQHTTGMLVARPVGIGDTPSSRRG